MPDDFDRIKNLLILNERMFTILGVWPGQSTYVKFTVWFVYMLIHITLGFADLFYVLGDLELTVLNLMETVAFVMTIVKLVVMKFSKKLVTISRRVIDGADVKFFESTEEMEIYQNYDRNAKLFFKICMGFSVLSELSYVLKPLEFRLKAALQNESMPFVLAYRTRFFFEVTESSTFWLVWIYQCPAACIGLFHTACTVYMIILVLHVCGQLSVLVFRIKNLDLDKCENHESSMAIFRVITDKHCNILEIAQDINEVFGLVLLEECLITTVIIGITCYSIIATADVDETGMLVTNLLYVLTMMVQMYVYCFAGEYLITESTNLYEAYYQCQWYVMSDSFKKQLIICMIGAKKNIQLNAGGFFVFSSVGFTSILKTSAGYISMLRAVV